MSIITRILRGAAKCVALALFAAHVAPAMAQTITLPAFDAGSFHTAFTVLGDGRVAAYTGDHVFVQDAIGARSFSSIGSLPAEFQGASDPAFILVAPNGLFFVLGAGAGGVKFPDPRFNGNIYVLPMLGALAEKTGRGEWVFASPRRRGAPIASINKAKERFRAATEIPDWRPHDLRRTAATYMGRLGVSRMAIARVLNHVESGVTAVYDRSTGEPEIENALRVWGKRLGEIVHGE